MFIYCLIEAFGIFSLISFGALVLYGGTQLINYFYLDESINFKKLIICFIIAFISLAASIYCLKVTPRHYASAHKE